MNVNNVLIMLLVTLVMALVETVMVYFLRTRGPLPFKIKIAPDFGLA